MNSENAHQSGKRYKSISKQCEIHLSSVRRITQSNVWRFNSQRYKEKPKSYIIWPAGLWKYVKCLWSWQHNLKKRLNKYSFCWVASKKSLHYTKNNGAWHWFTKLHLSKPQIEHGVKGVMIWAAKLPWEPCSHIDIDELHLMPEYCWVKCEGHQLGWNWFMKWSNIPKHTSKAYEWSHAFKHQWTEAMLWRGSQDFSRTMWETD